MTTARPTHTVDGAAYELLLGDALTVLKTLPANSVQCCVTSPPYYGLRDYGTATWEGGDANCDHKQLRSIGSSTLRNDGRKNIGTQAHEKTAAIAVPYRDTCGKCGARRVDQQLGIEATPDAYVAKLVDVFREVRRVLHPTGVLFLNLGDSYNTQPAGNKTPSGFQQNSSGGQAGALSQYGNNMRRTNIPGLKPKDLIGIPWMVAFALRADGWYLRSEIIWAKKAPMPESVTDRPTKAHEQVFLLAKSSSYFYDHIAIAEPSSEASGWARERANGVNTWKYNDTEERIAQTGQRIESSTFGQPGTRNKRSVWTLGPEPYHNAHYATMPTKLVEPCILAGTSAHGCCSACGAPWERVVEKEFRGDGNPYGYEERRVVGNRMKLNDRKLAAWKADHPDVDRGWQPTCTCNAPVTSCVVLDPFFGSGTVAAVALKHGRRFIGCDLDERNLSLAHDRIGRSQPLLLQVT